MGAPEGVWWRYFTQRCPQMRMPSVQHGHSLWGRAVIPFSHPAGGRTTRGRKSVVSLAQKLRSQMALPVIGAPMFIVSNPDLVIAQCQSGVIGSFPALNARPAEALETWIVQIQTALEQIRHA